MDPSVLVWVFGGGGSVCLPSLLCSVDGYLLQITKISHIHEVKSNLFHMLIISTVTAGPFDSEELTTGCCPYICEVELKSGAEV